MFASTCFTGVDANICAFDLCASITMQNPGANEYWSICVSIFGGLTWQDCILCLIASICSTEIGANIFGSIIGSQYLCENQVQKIIGQYLEE